MKYNQLLSRLLVFFFFLDCFALAGALQNFQSDMYIYLLLKTGKTLFL